MNEWQRVFKTRPDVVARRIAGETILVPIRGELADMQKIYALDAVAEAVWNGLDGVADLETVLARVVATFDVPEDVARRDVASFVAKLVEAGLVEQAGG
jgi:hypothetical protein